MESEYFTGYDIVIHLKLKEIEIVKLVQQGLLQPYTQLGKKLLPPGVEEAFKKIGDLSKEIDIIENKYPDIQNMSIQEWIMNPKRQFDANGKIIPIELSSGIDSTIMEDHIKIKGQRETAQVIIAKYSDLPSWKGYELPVRKQSKEKDINELLNAIYKKEDVLELERLEEQEERNIFLKDHPITKDILEIDNRIERKVKDRYSLERGIENEESQDTATIEELIRERNRLNDMLVELKESDIDQVEGAEQKYVDPISTINPQPLPAEPINFFIKEGEFWQIGYEGKTAILNGLDGVHYIALLLKQKPGTSILCRDLHFAISGIQPVNVMSEGAAIDEGLNVDRSIQKVGKAKARKICLEQYQELEEKLLNAGMEEQDEIKGKMTSLLPYLNQKERNFADANDRKAQVNIKKRLDKAYGAFHKAGMKEMKKHLQNHIRTDGAFGLSYTGTLAWEITIK